MKIRLLTVGKPREREAIGLHDRYAERIRRFGVSYDTAHVAEVQAGRSYSDDHVMQREAGNLLQALDPRDRVVALHPSGKQRDSEQVARKLESWATPRAAFVIGGPLGLHRDLLQRAEDSWSLSQLTFPHELVRVLVAEQLYRALTIRRGVPYHK
ncbi:MAG: 23S rRNA (pseudouridine(1915)-N(3))-methyltransferase RlmH [bacterium]|nr:23S rRNA (pseudouridine(1915)-N(3))-methyltransferase RlmH [bacterium]